ncbi:flagellar hook-length control protein FliK [Acetivibrio straminisolvens]|jgi:flagellar hook-length control protein FliK|nr:flagellar hook-length control protein FliK [Acetivibrio straminisolvens]
MITQNLIPDFISKMNMSKEVQKPSDVRKSSSSQFKDTLNLAVEKSNERQSSSYKNAMDIRGRDYQNLQSKISQDALEAKEKRVDRSKPFEKASNKMTSRTQDKAERTTSPKEKSIEGEIENDKKLKEKAMVKALSEVLGISSKELERLMAQLGINLGDISSEVGAEIAASKISEYLGLSSDEEMTLSKIVTLVQKEVEQAFMGKGAEVDTVEYSMNNESTQNGMEFENAESELAEDASVLKNKLGISEALKEIKDKLDEEPDGFIRQIAAKVVEVLEEDKNAAGLKAMDTNDESIEEVVLKTGAEDSSNIREVKSSSDEKGNAGTEERAGKEASSMASKGIEPEFAARNSNDGQFEAVSNSSIQKATGQAEVEKVQNTIPITKKEIVQQVVEKAKVVLSGDKSEMVIDLKPEHLGKLELKIVTERGMVIAKFVAENEQVKAALESNMNMLKESLEKQGFSVEGFSVTVGDNKRREDGRDEMNKGTANQRISNEKLQVSDVAGVERMQKIHQSINPYGYEGSSINLTA